MTSHVTSFGRHNIMLTVYCFIFSLSIEVKLSQAVIYIETSKEKLML